MGEGGLEFAEFYGKLVFYPYVGPCLLQEGAPGGGGVDGEVVGDHAEGTPCETEHGVGYRETAVVHVVLIIGRIESFAIVIVEVGGCLYEQIGFEFEGAVGGAPYETFTSSHGYHAIFCVGVILGGCLGCGPAEQCGG